ncbi:MAG TPA: formate dehydrogenase subunit alpha [Methanotrichaceae archaeon]|mgnify:CR=1 FL=1|nr:formate dehydrogenase subunit alpha [Methanotrichaceae archaeon]HQF15789.1 formate dehydrogenase subunit alpha [Methanotrichaceae archaeon]HQI90537.1 formate dehydrogenase subunit alpha [Methanotrichaceae archaeon]
MDEIRLIIDGREVKVSRGATILDAARKAGSYVPALCHHPDLKPIGSCKLCIVSVKGLDRYPTSCNTPAEEGMVVETRTEELQEMRRNTLEMLLALTNHPTSCLFCERRDECADLRECMRKFPATVGCMYCPKNEKCELQEAVRFVGLRDVRYQLSFKDMPVLREPFFDRNYNLCIMCGRCMRICEEVRGVGALSSNPDFHRMHWIGPESLQDSDCKFCGACVDVCPTGALYPRSLKWIRPEKEIATICPYCGVGCRLDLGVKENRIISTTPDRESPVNRGQACVKGRFGLEEIVHHPDRLTTPLIRRGGRLEEASWEEALDLVARRFAEIKNRHGPDSLGALSSSRCTNEENYLVQKLARAVFGTNNVDNCARVCHAPSVTGLAACFGSGAATNSFDQIEDADLLFVIGSNTTEAHPIVSLKMIKAAAKGAKIIVADPRKIELVDISQVWLNLRPGTNIALLNGMMNVILSERLEDRDFIARRTEGFEDMRKVVMKYPPSRAARITGVAEKDIIEAARLYAGAKNAMIIYSLGITEHITGTANVMSIGNLAMLTGNVGRRATGVMPLRGQNNVQGACDMGALPNSHVGYQPVADPNIHAKFEKAWNVKLPTSPGQTSTRMLGGAAEGRIRGLYILGEDPAQTDPDSSRVRSSLKDLDFLVVQEIFPTETTEYADVILPAASFAECDGTFTNGERRIQRVNKAIPPICGLENWQTICLMAQKMGYPMNYSHPSEIMDEIASLAPMFAGVSFDRLGISGLQWPCTSIENPGTETMHVERFSCGLGRFNAVEHKPPAEQSDPDYPLTLTTGRRREHYNCGSMTRRSKGIMWIWPEEAIEISPADARELGVRDGEMVLVSSRRGRVRTKAKVTDKSSRGVAFLSFHYPDVLTNLLTNAALDPQAKTPEYKACAIRIEKIGE